MTAYPIIGTVEINDLPPPGESVMLPWVQVAGADDPDEDRPAVNEAIALAVSSGLKRVLALGTFAINGPINLTGQHGLIFEGNGMQGTVFNPVADFPQTKPVFDCSGSLHLNIRDFRVGYYNQEARPQSAFQFAQTPSNVSNANLMQRLYASGSYGLATVVDYGVPSSGADHCQLYNYFPDPAKHPVLRWEASNLMGLASDFTTLATGPRSCGDWTWLACENHRFGGGPTAGYEVVSLDGVDSMLFLGGNMTGGAVSYVGLYGQNRNITMLTDTMETEGERVPVYSVYRYPGSHTEGLVVSNCYQINSGGTFGGPGTHS